jgi:hypothetical protein
MLGHMFEPFIARKIFNNKNLDKTIIHKIHSGVDRVVAKVIGYNQSKSALSPSPTYISPDVAISIG